MCVPIAGCLHVVLIREFWEVLGRMLVGMCTHSLACELEPFFVSFFVKNSVSQKIKSSSFEVSSVCFMLVYEAQNFMSTHFQVVSKSRGKWKEIGKQTRRNKARRKEQRGLTVKRKE